MKDDADNEEEEAKGTEQYGATPAWPSDWLLSLFSLFSFFSFSSASDYASFGDSLYSVNLTDSGSKDFVSAAAHITNGTGNFEGKSTLCGHVCFGFSASFLVHAAFSLLLPPFTFKGAKGAFGYTSYILDDQSRAVWLVTALSSINL